MCNPHRVDCVVIFTWRENVVADLVGCTRRPAATIDKSSSRVALIAFVALRTLQALRSLVTLVAFSALRSLHTLNTLLALITFIAFVALHSFQIEGVGLTVSHCEGYNASGVTLNFRNSITFRAYRCLKLNPVFCVAAWLGRAGDIVVFGSPHCFDGGILLTWREYIIASVIGRAGSPRAAIGKPGSRLTLVTLVTFRSLRAGVTFLALVTLIAFVSLWSLGTLNTLLALLSLLALDTLVTFHTLRALNTLRTLNTLVACGALLARVAFIALITLRTRLTHAVDSKICVRNRLQFGQPHIGIVFTTFRIHFNTHPHVAGAPVNSVHRHIVDWCSRTNSHRQHTIAVSLDGVSLAVHQLRTSFVGQRYAQTHIGVCHQFALSVTHHGLIAEAFGLRVSGCSCQKHCR